ncbi:TPA: hypothetical protein OXO77_003203 [Acinetobacter baumannii]|uniref:hypothetical protein n=1 Tax=Acinetobacter baumannii TaxID=470 RepID=UPI0002BA3292|nr:hypothetical protein [Acinetobacter baumannii]EKT9097622.1 hypothetical protein [Acinetobacter baumannii]EKU0265816.1 hypothetical protein [Acinetobacter baumannii]EKU0972019.1 hypothetical protein [Acinetobacter baumannii]EKU1856742.1 hypothetical protein [Acinetobacter baumannii]EKU1867427.1 hypothetical protein [Acinetobacter baumannii]
MDNYKIKVKDEAESKEAQELFEQLGFKWAGDYPVDGDWYSHLYAENSNCCYLSPYVWGGLGDRFKELTLPQLQDLVVLKRNDVKDATHKNFRTNTPYLKQGENEYYMFNGEWVLSNCPNDLEPITKPQDPALISGAEAKLAWANGEALQINKKDTHFGFIDISNDYSLGVFDNEDYEFRLKPQTIKVELELPKPFEPKDNDWVWTISGVQDGGITQMLHRDGNDYPLGAWRTEEEVKQVVEQLRKIRGTNS